MNILLCSSESLPFFKTGGLADVVYSLAKEYAKLKHSVSIVLPYYKKQDKEKIVGVKKIYSFNVKMNWRNIETNVYHLYKDKIDFYFIENDTYFKNDNYYGYYNDGERFAYFSNAIIELIKKLPFLVDIVHVNDHQVAMIPCLIKNMDMNLKENEIFKNIKTILTIHNPLFKGYLNKDSLFDLYNLPVKLYDEGKVRLDDQVSTLKAGIVYANKITTVSPSHHDELLTQEGSKGLSYDLTLRKDDFVGILNGMDTEFFNPFKDKLIYKKYSISSFVNGKKANKVEVCKKYNLNPELPLVCIISRLSDQKGLNLMYDSTEYLSYTGSNVIIIGSGEKHAEDMFLELSRRNSKHVAVFIGYNEELAHKVYAASDFLLMPSAFEPCGLSQMIAQSYGTLPIVRLTGGLKDTVIPYNYISDDSIENRANGFGFERLDPSSCIMACGEAVNTYLTKHDVYLKLVKNAMSLTHSWENSALKYIELYKSIK